MKKNQKTFFILIIFLAISVLVIMLKKPDPKIGDWSEIEPEIIKEFKSDHELLKAAKQLSLSIQAAIESPLEKALEVERKITRSINCIDYIIKSKNSEDIVFPIAKNWEDTTSNTLSTKPLNSLSLIEVFEKVRDITISSKAREERYLKYNSELDGEVFSLSDAVAEDCDFKVKEK